MDIAQQKGEEVKSIFFSQDQRGGAQDSPPEIILKDTYQKWGVIKTESSPKEGGRIRQQNRAFLRLAGVLK